jgi:hypothetical protein
MRVKQESIKARCMVVIPLDKMIIVLDLLKYSGFFPGIKDLFLLGNC